MPPLGTSEVFNRCFHFFLSNENNIAVYEDGIFRPYNNNESIDRLVRKTESFAFQMHAFEKQRPLFLSIQIVYLEIIQRNAHFGHY